MPTLKISKDDLAKKSLTQIVSENPLCTELVFKDIGREEIAKCDFSCLKNLSALQELVFYNVAIENINFLTDLKDRLIELSLVHIPATDFTVLASCTHLKKLDVSYTKFGPSFRLLSGLTNLQELELMGIQTDDFRFLAPLTNLTKLNLARTSIKGRDLIQLEEMNRLEELNLFKTPVADVEYLLSLKSLRELQLTDTRITTSDIESLTVLPNLTAIMVSDDDSLLATAKVVLERLEIEKRTKAKESKTGRETVTELVNPLIGSEKNKLLESKKTAQPAALIVAEGSSPMFTQSATASVAASVNTPNKKP